MIEIADQCPHLHLVQGIIGHPHVADAYGNIAPKFSCLNCFVDISLPALLRVMPSSEIVENLETSSLTERDYKSLVTRLMHKYGSKLASEEKRSVPKHSSGLNANERFERKEARAAEARRARIAQQQAIESIIRDRKERPE